MSAYLGDEWGGGLRGLLGGRIGREIQPVSEWQRRLAMEAVEAHMCGCIGPQPGHKLCPCMERSEAARRAEMRREILEEIATNITRQKGQKPRIRVKAGSRRAP